MSARVLIVEDEAAIRLALSGLLRRQGYQVAQAETGEKAIAVLQSEPFDLVITDLALGPGPSGMDVLREAHSLHAGLPGVLLQQEDKLAHGQRVVVLAASLLRNHRAESFPYHLDQLADDGDGSWIALGEPGQVSEKLGAFRGCGDDRSVAAALFCHGSVLARARFHKHSFTSSETAKLTCAS